MPQDKLTILSILIRSFAGWSLVVYTILTQWFQFFVQDEEEAGLLEQVKSQICDNVALYAQKYDEEFSPQLPAFVTAIWNLLISTGLQVKYDDVSEMIK